MTDQELVEDFISFIKKQLHYGSSKAPLLKALIDEYTPYDSEKEKLVAGLENLQAVRYNGENAVIDLKKIQGLM